LWCALEGGDRAGAGDAGVVGMDGVDSGVGAGVGIAGKLLDGATRVSSSRFVVAVRFFADDGMLGAKMKIAGDTWSDSKVRGYDM
jgi:hypothetical protein